MGETLTVAEKQFSDYVLNNQKDQAAKFKLSTKLLLISATGGVVAVMTGEFSFVGALAVIAGLLTSLPSVYTARKYGPTKKKLISEFAPPTRREYYSVIYPPSPKDPEWVLARNKRAVADERDRILKLIPNQVESESGFQQFIPGYGCEEPAFKSDELDQAIIDVAKNRKKIRVKIDEKDRFDPELGNAEAMLLHSKVFSNNKTVNDDKLSIKSDFVTGTNEVVVCRRNYFDGLVTNDIFRTQLYIQSDQSPEVGKLISDFNHKKVSAVFERGIPTLESLGNSKGSNHIGASMLVLSKDGYPIFFKQGLKQEQGAGNLVVSGSGSADWEDRLPQTDDFLQMVRRTMVREFMEEASFRHKETRQPKPWSGRIGDGLRSGSSLADVLDTEAKRVSVLGYFRWVSRMGKPEFCGAYRSDVKFADIEPDPDEVVRHFRYDLHYPIQELKDFITLHEKVAEVTADPMHAMSLSSAMTLSRIVNMVRGGRADDHLILRKAFVLPR